MKKLRNQEWFGRKDRDGFLYKSWLQNHGWPHDLFESRPVIGICSTWSELTPERGVQRKPCEINRAQEWTRTSTTLRSLDPESANGEPPAPASSRLHPSNHEESARSEDFDAPHEDCTRLETTHELPPQVPPHASVSGK